MSRLMAVRSGRRSTTTRKATGACWPGCGNARSSASVSRRAAVMSKRGARRAGRAAFGSSSSRRGRGVPTPELCFNMPKNDPIDAVLIARCTAAATDIREPPDARLALLAQHLTMIEQLTEDVGQVKTRREACREERIREFWKREVDRLKGLLNS